MLEKTLKFALVGNVISSQTQKLEVPSIKPDHPFVSLVKGVHGVELKLFSLMFDSFDSKKNFSKKLFFENFRKYWNEAEGNSFLVKNLLNFEKYYESKGNSDKVFFYNLTSCETLFRVSAIGLLRNCFDHSELEKILFDTIRCTLLTHTSPMALIGSVLISLSTSYIFRNGELKDLLDFLIDNIPKSDFVKAALYEEILEEFRENSFFEYYEFMRNISISQIKCGDLKLNDVGKSRDLRTLLRIDKFVISNVIKALLIVPDIRDYYEIVENILSNIYVTEFFSTFSSLLYGILNHGDEDIDRFSDAIEGNLILKNFLEDLTRKVKNLLRES